MQHIPKGTRPAARPGSATAALCPSSLTHPFRGSIRITTRVHTLTLTCRTPEQWWAAGWSQGPWAACWRHIRPDRLEAAQREAFALLDQLRGPDGTIGRTMLFACTTGRKEAL